MWPHSATGYAATAAGLGGSRLVRARMGSQVPYNMPCLAELEKLLEQLSCLAMAVAWDSAWSWPKGTSCKARNMSGGLAGPQQSHAHHGASLDIRSHGVPLLRDTIRDTAQK